MYAIISDVHANLEALEAVLKDIDLHGIKDIINLGDVVGYGPDPEACIDLVRKRCLVNLSGNHEYAILFGFAEAFNQVAEEAVAYHRERLEATDDSPQEKKDRWRFLKMMPSRYMRGDAFFVHGSPRNPQHEYIMEADVLWGLERKLRDIFAKFEHVLFVGHTHRPGVIGEDMKFHAPTDQNDRFVIGPRKLIVNVGAVGQPRDGDIRACYVTHEDNVVRFHRVPYDYQKTQAKVACTGRLDPSIGDRLAQGR